MRGRRDKPGADTASASWKGNILQRHSRAPAPGHGGTRPWHGASPNTEAGHGPGHGAGGCRRSEASCACYRVLARRRGRIASEARADVTRTRARCPDGWARLSSQERTRGETERQWHGRGCGRARPTRRSCGRCATRLILVYPEYRGNGVTPRTLPGRGHLCSRLSEADRCSARTKWLSDSITDSRASRIRMTMSIVHAIES